jgi:putative transposase
MKKRGKRHSREQIVKKLRDADAMLNSGKDSAAVLQTLEVSEATFHRWRAQFGGMKGEEAKRLKELETENSRLKRLLAEAELDKAMLKEALRGND